MAYTASTPPYAAPMTADFAEHVELLKAKRPLISEGKARFMAWCEGPQGLVRLKAEKEA